MMRRVVVTGMGMVTPLGCGVEHNWSRLIAGESGARKIDTFEVSDITCQIAGMIPVGDGTNGTYNADQWMEPKEQRKVDKFIVYAMCAAKQALDDAGWHPKTLTADDQYNTGVLIGAGIGGVEGIAETAITLKERGPRRVSPFFIPGRIINLASGYVSIEHGLKGPNHAVVTACSTGSHAIGDAGRLIALGDADVMVAGGTESPVNRISMAGFAAVRALSTGFNDRPTQASRPYDKDRDGFVMGEGSGCVVLEEYEHAKARGANILAEIVGYGATSDGYDMVAPSGEGAQRCMKIALEQAGNPKIDYLNPHGTSTPVGDAKEMEAVRAVFGDQTPMISSTKSLTGHSLGAAGAQEAIYCLLMMKHGFAAESAHIENLDPEFEGMPILRERHDGELKHVMSNSFGFGGTNASVIFRKVD